MRLKKIFLTKWIFFLNMKQTLKKVLFFQKDSKKCFEKESFYACVIKHYSFMFVTIEESLIVSSHMHPLPAFLIKN